MFVWQAPSTSNLQAKIFLQEPQSEVIIGRAVGYVDLILFSFRVVAAGQAATPPVGCSLSPKALEVACAPMRILLADDHEEFLGEFAALLAGRHEIVGAARDGEELVRLAASCHPDLILADINMPRMNGIAAIRKIIDQPVAPKAIFVTTHSSPQYIRHALDIGASGFVHKFYAFEQIEDAIEATLAGRVYLSPQLNFPRSPAAPPAAD